MLWLGSCHGWTVSMVKCFWHVKQVIYASYVILFSLIYVDVLLNFTGLIKYDLFFMLTVHHLMYLVLFSQKNSLWILQLQLVVKLTEGWGFFKTLLVEETWSSFLLYVFIYVHSFW